MTNCATQLTDEEILKIADENLNYGREIEPIQFARAILAAAQPAPVPPLTDEQVWANTEIMGVNAFAGMRMDTLMEMVRAIERAHGIAPGATK